MTRHFANLNQDGQILGFYSDDVHETWPDTCIEVSEIQWRELLVETDLFRYRDEAWIKLEREPIQYPYDVLRRQEYPGIGDQLDAILKYIQEMGFTPESPVAGIIAQWQAVKEKYPKPTA